MTQPSRSQNRSSKILDTRPHRGYVYCDFTTSSLGRFKPPKGCDLQLVSTGLLPFAEQLLNSDDLKGNLTTASVKLQIRVVEDGPGVKQAKRFREETHV